METLLVPSQAERTIPGKRVLVLAPHPDDEVFGCGGAIMRHVAQGASVTVRICTNGAYGVEPGHKAAYIATRQRESIAAAKVLGYGTPQFGAGEDRSLQYGEQFVLDLLALIDTVDADLVYAPSVMEMHPDHRAVGMAAVEAVRRRGKAVRLAQYEIGIPLRPNLLLDITDLGARKLDAMRCFASQLEKQRYDLDVAALNRYRSWTLAPEVTAAEAYLVTSGAELQGDPLGLYQSEHQRQGALGLPFDSRDLPLVSVMIRSMDRPSLALALDSVALQTYQNLEVVVVNAKGTAHRPLGVWCGRFPLRMIEPGHTLERSVAANTGLEAARGEFLIFLDDDDLFLPHHIARLFTEFKAHADAVAVYAGVVATDQAGVETQRFANAFDAVRLRIENYIPIHAVLFRRAVLARGARFDASLPVCEDWDFWLQLQEQGAFCFVPEIGAVYRMQTHSGSGVWVNQDATRRVVLGLYKKWVVRWTDTQLWALFEYARYRFLVDGINDAREQQGAASRERIATLENFIAAMNERLNAQIVELNKHNGELSTHVGVQAYHISRLQESLADQIRAIKDREAQLATIQGSTSWRVTRPLRALMDRVRGKPGIPALPAAPEPMPVTAVAPEPAPAAPAANATASAAKHHYDYPVDPDSRSAPAFVCELVGSGKRVLEIGCGPGSIARVMKARGQCRVTGIEVDQAAIALAWPHCEAIYAQDLNAENWPQVLGNAGPFDTVVAADVLEHLYDPWRTLRQMAALIGPTGSVVVSVPHAGHAAFVGCLVNNDVAYSETGLLDNTHIRFFGLRNIEALFAQADLKIVEVRFVVQTPEQTELAAHWNQLPEFVRAALRLSKYANIYQVVVRAISIGQPGEPVSLLNPD